MYKRQRQVRRLRQHAVRAVYRHATRRLRVGRERRCAEAVRADVEARRRRERRGCQRAARRYVAADIDGAKAARERARRDGARLGDGSEVVPTDYGYFHIIKLTGIESETMQSFDEVEDQLVSLYIKQAKEKSLFGSLEEFMNLSYEESLDMVADQFGLELQTSEYFSERSDQYDPKFVASAFSSAVIDEGENSEVMEMSPEKFVVLTLSDLQSERERELSGVEGQIEAALKTDAAKEVVDNLAENIASALSSGDEQTANQIISENNLEWVNEGWISRANELPYDVTSLSFTLAKPEEGRHTYSAESANRFTSLVIDLAGVRPPEEETDTGITSL